MTATNTAKASNSKKSQTSSSHFESLESRQMMSVAVDAALAPAPAEGHHHAAAVHVNKHHAAAATHTGNGYLPINIVVTPIRYFPTIFIEPKVDGNVTGWKNFSNHPLFAAGGPSANDIVQGDIGDCWFVSTLASVAIHDPSRIRNLVTQRADGTYDVRFYKNPTTTVDIHVDGLLPVNHWGGLEYAQLGQGGCDWVAIVEKAFTYFRNPSIAADYNTIAYGWGREAFSDLGGSFTEALPSVSNATQLFDDVIWGLIFNTAIDFGTNGGASGPLVHEHEYTVVSARESGGVDQIEVRNPWGYNPNYTYNSNGYGTSNNGYMWVSASSVLPELDEFVTASV